MIQRLIKRGFSSSTRTLNLPETMGNNERTEMRPENMLKRNFEEVKLPKTRFGPNLLKISVSYFLIIVVGITTFYFAKKEVDQNRQENMKLKKMISSAAEESKQYPSRFELIKAEKEREAALKKQNPI